MEPTNTVITYTLSTGEKHRRYIHAGKKELEYLAHLGEHIAQLTNLEIEADPEEDEPTVYVNPAHLVSIEVRALNYG